MANSRLGLRTRLGLVQAYTEGNRAIDADAQAFYDATGITDETQRVAINNLVFDLKNYGIWSKCKAIYPFVGGTASTHKWNLKDARDLDAAFRLVFSGGWTHGVNGATSNGTTAFGDSKFSPNGNSLTYDNNHLSFYSRTSAADDFYDIGAGDNSNADKNLTLWARRAANTSAYDTGDASNNRVSFSNSNGQGYYLGKANSTTGKIYKNGVQQATKSLTNYTLTAFNLYIGAYNEGGTAQYYTAREFAFASIGEGLTDSQSTDFYTAVQAFQTTLGRQV
jgi:hypothetical protein